MVCLNLLGCRTIHQHGAARNREADGSFAFWPLGSGALGKTGTWAMVAGGGWSAQIMVEGLRLLGLSLGEVVVREQPGCEYSSSCSSSRSSSSGV